MVDAFIGKWKLSDSQNFDNYLGAMGVYCQCVSEQILIMIDYEFYE